MNSFCDVIEKDARHPFFKKPGASPTIRMKWTVLTRGTSPESGVKKITGGNMADEDEQISSDDQNTDLTDYQTNLPRRSYKSIPDSYR